MLNPVIHTVTPCISLPNKEKTFYNKRTNLLHCTIMELYGFLLSILLILSICFFIMARYRLNTTKCVFKWSKKHQKVPKFNNKNLPTFFDPRTTFQPPPP